MAEKRRAIGGKAELEERAGPKTAGGEVGDGQAREYEVGCYIRAGRKANATNCR